MIDYNKEVELPNEIEDLLIILNGVDNSASRVLKKRACAGKTTTLHRSPEYISCVSRYTGGYNDANL